MSVKISIIIVSFNTKKLLIDTIQSIESKQSYEIIVIDNNSTDDSLEAVRQKFPKVKTIESKENLGFAKANNQAARYAKGQYLLLLNSDTKLKKNSLDMLYAHIASDPLIAAVTPKLVLPDGQIDIACHRGMPTPWNSLTYFLGLEKLFPSTKIFSEYHQLYKDLSTTHQIDAASATSLLIRKNVFDDLGGFDEQFFFYAEDLDLCKRINDAGFKILYTPEAEVWHYKSASGKSSKSKPDAKVAKYHFWHTMKLFYEKHYVDKYPKWLSGLVNIALDVKIHRYRS